MSARKLRDGEDIGRALRAARGATYVQDSYSTPKGHRGPNEAIRRTKELTTFSPCGVCSHHERQDLEDQLSVGMASGQVANSYGLDVEDIKRHRKYHRIEERGR